MACLLRLLHLVEVYQRLRLRLADRRPLLHQQLRQHHRAGRFQRLVQFPRLQLRLVVQHLHQLLPRALHCHLGDQVQPHQVVLFLRRPSFARQLVQFQHLPKLTG